MTLTHGSFLYFTWVTQLVFIWGNLLKLKCFFFWRFRFRCGFARFCFCWSLVPREFQGSCLWCELCHRVLLFLLSGRQRLWKSTWYSVCTYRVLLRWFWFFIFDLRSPTWVKLFFGWVPDWDWLTFCRVFRIKHIFRWVQWFVHWCSFYRFSWGFLFRDSTLCTHIILKGTHDRFTDLWLAFCIRPFFGCRWFSTGWVLPSRLPFMWLPAWVWVSLLQDLLSGVNFCCFKVL